MRTASRRSCGERLTGSWRLTGPLTPYARNRGRKPVRYLLAADDYSVYEAARMVFPAGSLLLPPNASPRGGRDSPEGLRDALLHMWLLGECDEVSLARGAGAGA